MTVAQVTVSAELGAVLGAVAIIVTAVLSYLNSRAANRKATRALESSPEGMFDGLRKEVAAILDAYGEARQRWESERDGMEVVLARERKRADAAEEVGLLMRGEVATMRIDLASARSEVADLRARFELAIAERHNQ